MVTLLNRPYAFMAISLFIGAGIPATAQTPSGILDCNISAGTGAVVTSTKTLACVFQPAGGGLPERYLGTLTTVGLDVGFTGAGHLGWAVAMADLSPRPYPLAGSYVGATAGIAVGGGAKANTLVGSNGIGVSLQPLSVATQTGLDLSAGVGSLTLTPDLPPPPPPPAGRR